MDTNFVSALGAGSGIDSKALAKSLMEASREPRKAIIDQRIAKTEARVSGYSVIQYSLGELKKAFAELNDLSDFASLKSSNSHPASFAAEASTGASPGSYSIKVKAIAQAQRVMSNGFPSRSTALNGGEAFTLALSVGDGATETITVPEGNDTPAGIASAINNAGKGLRAQLINTSGANPLKIVVTGSEGAAKSFTLSPVDDNGDPLELAGLDTSDTPYALGFELADNLLQSSRDASLEVNGLSVTRSTNTFSDVINNVKFQLYAPTPSTATEVNGQTVTSYAQAQLEFTRETGDLSSKIQALVKAYNEFEGNLKILGDRDSKVEEFGGVLAGDSLLQTIRTKVRTMLTAESRTPGTVVKAARDVGLDFDRNGVLQFDEEKFTARLMDSFEDVVKVFTANTNKSRLLPGNVSVASGVAGDAVNRLDELMGQKGLLTLQTNNANEQITRHKADLQRLEVQMQRLLERYTRQFSAMDEIVGRNNSLRDSLTNTFEGMSNAYKR